MAGLLNGVSCRKARPSPRDPGLRRDDGSGPIQGLRMHIVDQVRFLIGLLFALIGVGVLVSTRRSRGFGQRKQAGVLLLVAAAIFIAIGLGYDPRALIGR